MKSTVNVNREDCVISFESGSHCLEMHMIHNQHGPHESLNLQLRSEDDLIRPSTQTFKQD